MTRSAQEWRVRHEGRDDLYYEGLHDGAWRRLPIGGGMLVGRPRHVIYFGSKADWSAQPDWAQGRREEILARIKRACPAPDYTYDGEAVFDSHDRAELVKEAGGLSTEACAWAGCAERALKDKALCLTHLYQPEIWSDLDRSTSAST